MILTRKVFPIMIMASLMLPGFLTDAIGQNSAYRQGDKALCNIGDINRRVEVHYYENEKAVPCEVHYYKDTEEPGEDRVLWRAESETGYCENKMTAFVGELTGFGWYCEEQGNNPPALQHEKLDGGIPPALQLDGASN
jgi:hypothetical protein